MAEVDEELEVIVEAVEVEPVEVVHESKEKKDAASHSYHPPPYYFTYYLLTQRPATCDRTSFRVWLQSSPIFRAFSVLQQV